MRSMHKNGKLQIPLNEELLRANILALVPWADSINHFSSVPERSILQHDVMHDAAVPFAHKAYDAGEEARGLYGTRLKPEDLLLDYSFVDPKNSIAASNVCADHPAKKIDELQGRCMLCTQQRPLFEAS
jgi:hypothetical protein